MDYYDKYLKYKLKYVNLKIQLGKGRPSYTELHQVCDQQIRTNPNLGCSECIYQYTSSKTSKDIESVYTSGISKSYKHCIPHEKEQIFNRHIRTFEKLIGENGDLQNIIDPIGTNDIKYILSSINYLNFDENNHDKLYLKKFNDTIVAEGNIVYVAKEYKVASTTIDSCLFIIIILSNGDKICLHHNMNDINYLNFSKEKNLTDEKSRIFGVLKYISQDFGMKRIYMCGINQTFGYYKNLTDYYKTLVRETEVTIFTSDTPCIFLVNSDNQVIVINK